MKAITLLASITILLFASCEEKKVETQNNPQSDTKVIADTVHEHVSTDTVVSEVIDTSVASNPCVDGWPEQPWSIDNYPEIPTTDVKVQVEDVANYILNRVKDLNWEKIGLVTHPDHPVLFSPDVHINRVKGDLSFKGQDFAYLYQCGEDDDWNVNHPSGEPQLMNFADYFNTYVLSVLEGHYDLYINEWLSWGTTSNNMKGAFPESEIVQAMNEGEDELDWKALNLVFKKIEGHYFLVGMISDYWTP